MVAVPGHEHDVVCYERLNWKPLLTLRGEHTARVNLVAFAPDGTSPRVADAAPASLARAQSDVVLCSIAPESGCVFGSEGNIETMCERKPRRGACGHGGL